MNIHLSSSFRCKALLASIMVLLFLAETPSLAKYNRGCAVTIPENGLGGVTGKISGDLKGVGSVVVTLMQNEKVVDKAETDADGFYKFRYVEPGTYDLKAIKDGHVTCIVITIPVGSDRVTKLDFYLPKINNDHMPDHPIVETYDYYRKRMSHPDSNYPRKG